MGKTLQTPANEAPEITAEQLAERAEFLGGTVDDIDNEDFSNVDDGSDLDYVAPEESAEDKGDDDKGDDSDDDSSKAVDDDDDGDTGDADTDADDDSADADDDAADDDSGDDDSDADDTDDDDSEPKPKAGIPKYRFDEVNERAKAAEAEIARRDALDAAKDPTPVVAYDFDSKDKELMELQLDGKIDEASALRKEIRAAEKAEWLTESNATTKGEISTEAAQDELDGLAIQAEAMYPCFDENSEDFDPDLTDKVMIYASGYAQSGKARDRGDAFVMGLADVIAQESLDERYGEDDAAVEDDTKPKKKAPIEKTEQKKKLADQQHTPVGGEGSGSDDAGQHSQGGDLEQMTDEDFDALPLKTQQRLRGDFDVTDA